MGWAAGEADRRGHRLVLANAMAIPAGVVDLGWPEQAVRRDASVALEQAEQRARSVVPELDVTSTALDDPPAAALVQLAEDADAAMVVVGLRGRGGFPGMKVGSIAYHVAAHSPVPVVVVGPELAADANPEVVVGVDGSTYADDALAAAFEEAALGGSRVRAVSAWPPPPLREPALIPYADAIRKEMETDLAQALRPWRAKYPDVAVASEVVESQPVLALTRAAAQARLIVVGARGLRGLPRLALGGVAHGLLHHAPCPVMVVH
ncbi:universal stress protein [Allosalinactinospora lopnorensis]|uniref:universal stress protein n=1 Tax=Allosalinactinospora lopnorensis TaxID=1352348 RepID=UPI000A8FA69C|nr:universal stress protein [Allosalinactinospora lopnorensis]